MAGKVVDELRRPVPAPIGCNLADVGHVLPIEGGGCFCLLQFQRLREHYFLDQIRSSQMYAEVCRRESLSHLVKRNENAVGQTAPVMFETTPCSLVIFGVQTDGRRPLIANNIAKPANQN